MNVIFNEKCNFWKVIVDSKANILRADDFLVLTGLRDRDDRNFHDVSELTLSSKLDDQVWRKCIKKLRKTQLIRYKKNSYRISCIGEFVVDSIRRNEVDVVNSQSGPLSGYLKRLLGFEAG
jgi:hypothetical protein